MGHATVAQARTHFPALVDGAQERAPAHTDRRGRRLHRGRARHPAQERMELGHPGAVLAPAHATGRAENRISSAAFPPRLFRSCASVSRTYRTASPSVISLVPCAQHTNSTGNRKVKHAPGLTPATLNTPDTPHGSKPHRHHLKTHFLSLDS